jgi:hypothetical protein
LFTTDNYPLRRILIIPLLRIRANARPKAGSLCAAFFLASPKDWMRRRARRRTVKAEHRRIQTFGLDAEERRLKALHWFLYPEAVGTLPI